MAIQLKESTTTTKKPTAEKKVEAARSKAKTREEIRVRAELAAGKKLLTELLARHHLELEMPFPYSEIQPGWATIVDELLRDLAAMGCKKILQIKEKWGLLRVYTDGPGGAEEDARIDKAEKLSGRTCCECGARGTQHAVRDWQWSRCPACAAALKKRL